MFLIWQSIQIRISPKWGKCTWNSNLQTKCRTERRFHAFKFSDGYKSTMDWCSVYLTPQALPKYIYLSPPLIFPTTSTELGQKTARFASCYFTCTCLVFEISLFGSIAVNIVVKVFHIWHSDPYMDRLRPSRVYVRCHGGQETIFEYKIDREGRNRYCNTYYVSPSLKKIVGNNKLCPT
jgi:hypothetical protein